MTVSNPFEKKAVHSGFFIVSRRFTLLQAFPGGLLGCQFCGPAVCSTACSGWLTGTGYSPRLSAAWSSLQWASRFSATSLMN